jgi:hypothetical protein
MSTATATLKKDVQGLASALTSGGSDVSAAMSAQMATLKTSATALGTAITAVPAGSAGGVKVQGGQSPSQDESRPGAGVSSGEELFLFLIFTEALIAFRKGHLVSGFLGIILSLLWLFGAVLPDGNEGMTSGTGHMTPSM